MSERKRKSKASGPRSEVFAMRLDPKLKYLAEIAARKQRRSLASFVEMAIEQALSKAILAEVDSVDGRHEISVLDESTKLWDLEPSDRFLKLAENYPELLTYEEQVIWKAIHEIQTYSSYKDDEGKTQTISHSFLYRDGKREKPERGTIKECWPALVAFSLGEATERDVREAMVNVIPF